mmetsp:Transcript_54327/g.125131  ORF Transcript_54327/g.125131 Transcript_54327/m.125131 type:complete len:222 (-) Transcript_54327:326-991(-)
MRCTRSPNARISSSPRLRRAARTSCCASIERTSSLIRRGCAGWATCRPRPSTATTAGNGWTRRRRRARRAAAAARSAFAPNRAGARCTPLQVDGCGSTSSDWLASTVREGLRSTQCSGRSQSHCRRQRWPRVASARCRNTSLVSMCATSRTRCWRLWRRRPTRAPTRAAARTTSPTASRCLGPRCSRTPPSSCARLRPRRGLARHKAPARVPCDERGRTRG